MLWSFHHAARGGLVGDGAAALVRPEDVAVPGSRAFFFSPAGGIELPGALPQEAGDAPFLPADRPGPRTLLGDLRAREVPRQIEREIDRRPGWLRIPLRGILEVLADGAGRLARMNGSTRDDGGPVCGPLRLAARRPGRLSFTRAATLRLHDKLGSHPVWWWAAGVHFAVWAPNALAVTVMGDFKPLEQDGARAAARAPARGSGRASSPASSRGHLQVHVKSRYGRLPKADKGGSTLVSPVPSRPRSRVRVSATPGE